MLAVSNTSPVSNLASLGRLELLASQFSEVWIPKTVLLELGFHPDPLARSGIEAAVLTGRLHVDTVPDSHVLRMLRASIDPGEAEAIALALQKGIGTVLMDEKDGRDLAKLCGLKCVGVLGILLEAKRVGQLDLIAPEIRRLREDAHFYIARSLENRVLAEAGETLEK